MFSPITVPTRHTRSDRTIPHERSELSPVRWVNPRRWSPGVRPHRRLPRRAGEHEILASWRIERSKLLIVLDTRIHSSSAIPATVVAFICLMASSRLRLELISSSKSSAGLVAVEGGRLYGRGGGSHSLWHSLPRASSRRSETAVHASRLKQQPRRLSTSASPHIRSPHVWCNTLTIYLLGIHSHNNR